ncbi:CRISPR-associated endonuclease Cas2 [Kurthia massiliensis]|uniref:CRISPR-associated endonuclease Cas2 n=1 Tax=Kurthia massiliensis TaxID=1033739 RepID=UPI00028913A0|nr:CRISPR-associated endonuclease Cas2 [Kurthia massiliensis]
MLVLVTYDVSTKTSAGRKRLRQVAKICCNSGVRVQNSVFECIVDQTQFIILKKEIANIIDPTEDSIRFYRLGNQYKSKVEHIGTKQSINVEDPLIF